MNDLAQKPFQLILTIVFGMLALLGLYVFATFSGFGGSGSKIGTVVIWGTLPAAVINQEISTLTTSDKSYAKVTYVQQQAANFDDILANAIASGSGPDMILISQEQLLSEESKIRIIPFSTIPQRNFLSDYLPEFQLYLTSTGTYGVPYALDPMVLYYNTSLLSQAGISQPPTSWEAVTGLAPTLTHLNPDKSIAQSAVPFGSYNNTENSFCNQDPLSQQRRKWEFAQPLRRHHNRVPHPYFPLSISIHNSLTLRAQCIHGMQALVAHGRLS
jgi:ABC-type glycerol-3-phosphate transport system substrate-binding protein